MSLKQKTYEPSSNIVYLDYFNYLHTLRTSKFSFHFYISFFHLIYVDNLKSWEKRNFFNEYFSVKKRLQCWIVIKKEKLTHILYALKDFSETNGHLKWNTLKILKSGILKIQDIAKMARLNWNFLERHFFLSYIYVYLTGVQFCTQISKTKFFLFQDQVNYLRIYFPFPFMTWI